MAKSVRELLIKFGVKTDRAALDRFTRRLERARNVAIGVAAGVVTMGAALVHATTRTAEQGDRAAKLAEQLGMSAESVQELDHALRLHGTTFEQVRPGMQQFNRLLDEAAQGSDTASRALRRGGVDLSAYGDRLPTLDEALGDIAARFATMTDETERNAVAQRLFGEEGGRLVPLLARGREGIAELRAEAHRLGVVLSNEDAAAAEEFGDTMLRARQIVTGFRNQAGLALMPVLTDLVERFGEWVENNRDLIRQRIRQFMEGLIRTVEDMARTIGDLVDTVKDIVDEMGGWEAVINQVKAALLVMVTYQAVQMIMTGVTALRALAAGFRAAGIAGMIAAGQAFLIPALIALLIVGIGILAEDLYRFFKGQDSLIGQWVDAWAESDGLFGDVARWLREMQQNGDIILQDMKDSVLQVVEDIENAFRSMFETIGGVTDGIGRVVGGISDALGFDNINLGGRRGEGSDRGDRMAPEIGHRFNDRNARTQEEMMADIIAEEEARGPGRGRRFGGGDINAQANVEINITQQPGESGEDLGRRIDQTTIPELNRQMAAELANATQE